MSIAYSSSPSENTRNWRLPVSSPARASVDAAGFMVRTPVCCVHARPDGPVIKHIIGKHAVFFLAGGDLAEVVHVEDQRHAAIAHDGRGRHAGYLAVVGF